MTSSQKFGTPRSFVAAYYGKVDGSNDTRMSGLTPIASRLAIALDDEYLRMQNEWFFKWHFIGRDKTVEIESFSGKPIRYGGSPFSGTAELVYWETIQRYLRKKIGSIFDDLEHELARYPVETRQAALNEVRGYVTQFALKIRRAAVEKDRVLRGNGTVFPAERDQGNWLGGRATDIDSRIAALSDIYCKPTIEIEGKAMSLQSMMTDKLSLIKKDGSVVSDNVSGSVSKNLITTFSTELPIEPGDHFLRKLPNGMVEDFVVEDPQFYSGLHNIKEHYQVKVRRSNMPVASPQTAIQNITNVFHGANSRVNIGSTDNSVNIASEISAKQITAFLEQVRPALTGLSATIQTEIAGPISELESELKKPEPSQSKVRAALQSIKAVVEGATGNLVAAGIGGLIGQMLG